MKKIRVIEGWARDLGIPSEWIAAVKAGEATLHNAARPFPCTEEAVGEFVHGVFYGIIYNADKDAELHRKRAAELDASEMVFVERATVEAWGREYCDEHGLDYDDYDFDTIAKSWLRHSGDG